MILTYYGLICDIQINEIEDNDFGEFYFNMVHNILPGICEVVTLCSLRFAYTNMFYCPLAC